MNAIANVVANVVYERQAGVGGEGIGNVTSVKVLHVAAA